MKSIIAKISAAKLATVIGVSAILGGGIFAVTAISTDNGADAITRKAPSSAETSAVVAAGLGDVKAVSPGRVRANQTGSTVKSDFKVSRAAAVASSARAKACSLNGAVTFRPRISPARPAATSASAPASGMAL